jgi:uncharacterized protein (DUF2236 family)
MRTMPAAALPAADEVAHLVPAPGSILWDYGADARLLATASYALMLQVAHPTVAAGVREHSDYARDPGGGCCAPSTTST